MATPLKIIHRTSGQPERQENFGPYTIESLIAISEEGAGTVYRVCIEPHRQTSISYHQVAEEYYYVLAGSGRVVLDDQEYQLAVGDFLRLPPGTRHAFITQDEPLELLDIHTPGCRPNRDTYFVDNIPEGFQTPDQ